MPTFPVNLRDRLLSMKKFQNRTDIVLATQLTKVMEIESELGAIRGLPGQWLVIDREGNQSFWNSEDFEAKYQEVNASIAD